MILRELSCKQVSLSVIELDGLLLSLLLFAAVWVLDDEGLLPAVLNLIGESKPYVVTFVPGKLCRHLKNLNSSNPLQVVTDLMALYFGIAFKISVFQQFEMVNIPVTFKIA